MNAELVAARKLRFDILHDDGNEVAAAFGLRHALPDDLREVYRGFGIDLEAANGDTSWTLPIPARIVIDRGGIIRHVAADTDYTRRPEVEDTLTALASLD